MSKPSVEVDRAALTAAANVLGTTSIKDTIDASLREVVRMRLRAEAVELLAQPDRLDVDAMRSAWGNDET